MLNSACNLWAQAARRRQPTGHAGVRVQSPRRGQVPAGDAAVAAAWMVM